MGKLKGLLSLYTLISIFLVSSAQQTDTYTGCKANLADIVFLVDSSGSIGDEDFVRMKQFLQKFIMGLEVDLGKVKIGVAQFSNDPHKEFLLGDYNDKQDLLKKVKQLTYIKGGTYTGKALDFITKNYFTNEGGSRINQNVPQIAVVITDGDSSDKTEIPAMKLRKKGVLVFVIGIGSVSITGLQSIANKPYHYFVLDFSDYENLLEKATSTVDKVCISMEAEQQALAPTFADVFVLIDSSVEQPQKVIQFLRTLATQLNVASESNRMALAQFSNDVSVEFNFNDYKTKNEALTLIRKVRIRGSGQRKLGKAIDFVHSHLLDTTSGSRIALGYKQYLLVVSKGESDDNIISAARSLMDEEVTIVNIDFSKEQDIDLQKRMMAPPKRTIYGATKTAVEMVQNVTTIMKSKDEISVTGDCKSAVADIVFIMDVSDRITLQNFRLVQDFLHRMIDGLNIMPDSVRVGMVLYSDNPTADFYLNTFVDKQEILQRIKHLHFKGGKSKTSNALKFAREKLFTKDTGSRRNSGVQQIAVVITGGDSSDNVTYQANLLRSSGVQVYALGLLKDNEKQLKEIASYPPENFFFIVDSFVKLNSMEKILRKTLCDNVVHFTDKSLTYSLEQGCLQTEEADIYFLIDQSSSIYSLYFEDMKTFILKFLQSFTIGPKQVRVGVVKYSDDPELEFSLDVYTNRDSLTKAVSNIVQNNGNTNTGRALSFMTSLFQKARKDRKILIVITDGESGDKVKEPAEQLREQGVTIYAIGVKDANEKELIEIAGDQKRMYFVTDFGALKLLKEKIVVDICSEDVCKKMQQADVIFLADGSGSIKTEDFSKMKNFLNTLVVNSTIGKAGVQFGLVQYSESQKVEFALNKFSDKVEMQQAINDMQQLGGGTLTGGALSILADYFGKTKGGRPDIPQILIVITDGESQDAVAAPAVALRGMGIKIYSIGVLQANVSQLIEISGARENVYIERDFDGLDSLKEKILLKICTDVDDCQKSQVADVVFLVDDSSSIGKANFNSMKVFMNSVVNNTQVGKDSVHFCTILYSDTAKTKFALNQYYSKQDVWDAINNLEHNGGNTYTARALHYSLDYFSEANGGRHATGVPQMLFVITDGEATDSSDLSDAANELEKKGISVYGIGVAKANIAELQTITRDESKVYKVDDFNKLGALQKNISKVICINTKPECKKEVADLVILIDGSLSIGDESWKTMINFTLSLIDNLRIKQELFRVGVAQFSTDYRKEFYLNEYNNEEDVKKAIQSIVQMMAYTEIGAALKRVQEFFHASKGSRIKDGISQNLLLITDGVSQDRVDVAAQQLRDMGIEMFVIGIGNISFPQLQIIAGSPKRVYVVGNFDHLKLNRTTQQVISRICTPEIDPSCTVDIGIGFDLSHISRQYRLQGSLQEIIRQISTLHNLCCVPQYPSLPTNIGFRLVASDGSVLYDPNFEKYDEDVVKKVMAELTKRFAFNTQLLQSFKEKFAHSGAGVKALIIFTDGLDESVDDLMVASKNLRESGVHSLIPVALEGIPNIMDLEKLEFGRGSMFTEPLRISMHDVAGVLQKQIDAVASRECCNVWCKCTGHKGVPGSQGPPGTKGSPGSQGYFGFPGEVGIPGDRGPPGPNGTQGYPGCQGRRGLKGIRGYRGDIGSNGEQGLDGINGEQGQAGFDGYPGEPGDPGSHGKKGIKGDPGDPGQLGLRGDPGDSGIDNNDRGPKGEAGYTGMPGEPGPDGGLGRPGDAGSPGYQGRRGPAGQPGVPGPLGEPGLKGSTGASGPQGPMGPRGDSGQQGMPGLPGSQGAPGTQGNVGGKGNIGPRGQKGQPGEPGIKGTVGPLGRRGPPGNDGPDGYGVPGTNGQKGNPGFPGYPGKPGDPGDPGRNGDNGSKGQSGRGGNAGQTGPPGIPGDNGKPGHRGPKGPPGTKAMSTCQLISYVQDNCACCKDKAVCPVFPTELVIGLDMSDDITPALFGKMRSTLLSLLDSINIAESNCPTGTRVSVVSYSSNIKYLIRFSDYRFKRDLVEAVKSIPLERTSNKRNIGEAMRFVGRNVFKRIRQGVLIRKVAIFLAGGRSQDETSITTAVLEYKALDINLGVIGFRDTPNVQRAFEADETGSFILSVLDRTDTQTTAVERILRCVICFDPCNPARDCPKTSDMSPLKQVDVDLALLVDGSQNIQADQYEGVKQVLATVLDQLVVSDQPTKADRQARVALYQQSSSYSEAQASVKQIFAFQRFQNGNQMKQSIFENLEQTGGYSRLGQAMEFVIMQGLFTVSRPRKNKMVLLIVGGETEYSDKAKLERISMIAKCQGVVLFTVTVGDHFGSTQVEKLASFPTEQHIVHLGHVKQGEQKYIQHFIRTFLHILKRGKNAYPPSFLKTQCNEGQNHAVTESPPTDWTPSPTVYPDYAYGGEEDEMVKDTAYVEHLGTQIKTLNVSLLTPGHKDSNDVCHLKKDSGPCSKYVIRWYYNQEQNKCSRFLYGGCDGNLNRFDSQYECEDHCMDLHTIQ